MKLLNFSLVLLLMCSAGCGLREAKKQQRMREAKAAAKETAQWNQEINEEQMKEAAKKARRDMNNRIRYARALEGIYSDEFTSTSETDGSVYHGRLTLSITPLNLPAPFVDERPIDAAQVQAQMEAISFAVEIFEESMKNPEIRYLCTQLGVKPDYERGLIRVTCQGAMSAPSRDYLIALDDDGFDGVLSVDEDTVYNRSALASLALIEGRLPSMNVLNVRISSPFGKIYRAKIRRDTDEFETPEN